jgi:small-conductance mechanosensitive channel
MRIGTSEEQLSAIPQLLKDAVLAQGETAAFERAHLAGLAEWSLNFETVYWIKSPDYLIFMDTQQAIFLSVVRELAARGIELAVPMRLMVPEPAPVTEAAPPPQLVRSANPVH